MRAALYHQSRRSTLLIVTHTEAILGQNHGSVKSTGHFLSSNWEESECPEEKIVAVLRRKRRHWVYSTMSFRLMCH